MPKKVPHLLRGPDGRMRTILAGSCRSALKKFLAENKKAPSGDWSVKERNSDDDWCEFTVK